MYSSTYVYKNIVALFLICNLVECAKFIPTQTEMSSQACALQCIEKLIQKSETLLSMPDIEQEQRAELKSIAKVQSPFHAKCCMTQALNHVHVGRHLALLKYHVLYTSAIIFTQLHGNRCFQGYNLCQQQAKGKDMILNVKVFVIVSLMKIKAAGKYRPTNTFMHLLLAEHFIQ